MFKKYIIKNLEYSTKYVSNKVHIFLQEVNFFLKTFVNMN